MKIQSLIKNGEYDAVLEYIKTNYHQLPESQHRDDPLILSFRHDNINIRRHLLNRGYHMLCNREKQLEFLKNAVSRNCIYELTKLLDELAFTKDELNLAFFHSSAYSEVLTLKILLDAGTTISTENSCPLIYAIDAGNTDGAVFLIDQLDDIHFVDEYGFSLLHHVAAISRDEKLLQYLIYRKLDVNLQNISGRTPLMLSLLSIEMDSENLFFDFGSELLDAGADVNITDNNGDTVLMLACMYNNYTAYGDDYLVEYMEMLVTHGADVNKKNDENKTALDIAREHHFVEAVEFLERHTTEELIIPSTDVHENTNAQPKLNNYPDSSFLSEKGYNTKISRAKRWSILCEDVLTEYPPQVVINKLTDFIKRFKSQRNGSKKYAEALAEWEYDIQRIKKHYSN